MASIAFEHGAGLSGGFSLRQIAGGIVAAWRRHRAEQELEGLPFDLMKDIGYPAVDAPTHTARARDAR